MKINFSKIDILALVVGAIIGWGAFTLPGEKFLIQSGVLNTWLGLIIGGISILFIQSGYHLMLLNQNKEGGELSYAYNNLGRINGYIVGWSLAFCYLTLIPLNAMAVVLVSRQIFPNSSYGYLYTISNSPVYCSDIIIASLIILIFFVINMEGLNLSMFVQRIMIIGLVIIIFAMGIYMIFAGNHSQFKTSYIENYNFSLKEILQVIAIVPFLFVGFNIVPQVATNIGLKPRSATKLTVLSLFVGVMIYGTLNTMTALSYTPKQAFSKSWAAGSAILEYLGYAGFIFLCIALLSAVSGGLNAYMLGSSRVIASLSTYNLVPSKLKELNKHNVPIKALCFVSIIGALMPLFGREVILYIVDLSSLMAAIVYAYVCYISRIFAQNNTQKIRVNIGIIISCLFIFLLVWPSSPSRLSINSFIILGIWIFIGIIFYILNNTKIKNEYGE